MRGTPPNPRRVLITRLSAIGDCILTLPLAVKAKQLWPDCSISWIVDCPADQFLAWHDCIDEVIKIEKRWMKTLTSWTTLRSELRDRQFDLVLDPQGLTKSACLGWLSGARRRIGFGYSQAREIAPWLATRRVKRTLRHKAEAFMELLSPWTEIQEGSAEFQMPHFPDSARRADQILAKSGLPMGDWVAINPGAGWTTRLWPIERFAALSRELYACYGLRSLVFWAGETELLMAQAIAEASRGSAVLAPATSLTESLELIRKTRLLVTSETAAMHMASAVDAPCVSLHGPTWADESGPYRNPHVAIQSSILPGRKMARKGDNTAMRAIEVDEVVRSCCRLLDSTAACCRIAA